MRSRLQAGATAQGCAALITRIEPVSDGIPG